MKYENFVIHITSIIADDLKIIENKKLKKHLTKVSNYRKPRSINFRKANFEINQVLETSIENMSTKNKLEASKLAPWRESVLTIIKEKN